jgi:Rrf2 family protein
VTIPFIAKSEALTVEYVAKLMRILRQTGLLVSTRGVKGGYRLSRTPEEMTIREILVALSDRLYTPAMCKRYTGGGEFCVHSSDCSMRSMWRFLDGIVDAVTDHITLADLIGGRESFEKMLQARWELDGIFRKAPLPAEAAEI